MAASCLALVLTGDLQAALPIMMARGHVEVVIIGCVAQGCSRVLGEKATEMEWDLRWEGGPSWGEEKFGKKNARMDCGAAGYWGQDFV